MIPAHSASLVLGGGPAGAAAAIVLAEAGVPVVLLERAHFPRPRIGESLPPKVEPLFRILGVDGAIEAAAFARMVGTTILQGPMVTHHPFDPSGQRLGWQVERGRFDALLLARARQAGVLVFEGVKVTEVLRQADRVTGVRWSSNELSGTIHADWVVDASGRRALVARSLGLMARGAVRTVAWCGYWRNSLRPEGFDPHDTLFEMLPEGWIWSLLRADGLRNVTLGTDPAWFKGRRRDWRTLYLEVLRFSKLIEPLLAGADWDGQLTAHDSTWSWSRDYAGPGWILAGDAASFADPLTSQGVYKALTSGILAGAVVRTALQRLEHQSLALQHYRQGQRRFAASYAAITAASYRASGFAAFSPFWARRIDGELLPADGRWATEVDEGPRRRERFRVRLRELGGQKVRLLRRPQLALQQVGVAEGGWIVPASRLVIPEATGVDAVLELGVDAEIFYPLLDGRTVADLFEAYSAHKGLAPSGELGRTLMTALGILVERDAVEVKEVP